MKEIVKREMIDPSNIKQEKSSPLKIKQEMRDASKALHDMSDTSNDSESDSSDRQSENDSSSPDNDSDASSSDNERESSSSNSDRPSGSSNIYKIKIGQMKDRVKQELVDSSIIKQEKHDSPKVKQDKYRPNSPKVKQEMRYYSSSRPSDSESSDGDSSVSDGANKPSSRRSDRDPSATPSNLPVPSFKVLDNMVKTPSKYDVVESPGPLTVSDIKPENEYYIFRVPLGLINPIDLIDTKFCIGSKETRKIELNDKLYEVSTYENSMPDMPTVFLPDNAGRLNQVDLQIKSHVVITQAPLNAIENTEFDIDDLRSKVHKPPEIKERNFFASSGAVKQISKKEKLILKKKKLSKEEKRLSKEMKKLAEEKTLSKEKKNLTLEKEKYTSKKKKLSKEERKLSKEEKEIAKGKKRLKKEKKLSKTKNILSEKGNPLPEKKKKRSLNLEENFSPSLSPNKKKKN